MAFLYFFDTHSFEKIFDRVVFFSLKKGMIDFLHHSSYNDFVIRLYDGSFCDDRIYYENTQNNNINQTDQCYKLRSDESYERYLYK